MYRYNLNHQASFCYLGKYIWKDWANTGICQKKKKKSTNKVKGFWRCLKPFYDLKTKLTVEIKIQDRKAQPKVAQDRWKSQRRTNLEYFMTKDKH